MAEYLTLLMVFAPTIALVRRMNLSTTACLASGLAVTAFALVPFADVSVMVFLRGLVGDLSMSSTVLLGYWAIASIRQVEPNESRKLIACSIFSVAGFLFYATALGLGSYDPYTLGYEPRLLSSIAAALCLVCIWSGWYLVAACLLAALIAYPLQALPSQNLWDYLIDAPLWLFSLGSVAFGIVRRYRGRLRSA